MGFDFLYLLKIGLEYKNSEEYLAIFTSLRHNVFSN